jgi:threonine/homoserine/homoserine lactone efflux protein
LPLAIAVTISPIPIIAEILLLFTKKPVPNAGAYLAGFILGVGGILGILVAAASTLNLSAGSGPSKGAGIVQLVLGLLLLAASVRSLRGRPKQGEAAPMPKWMDGIAGFAPGKSFAVGAAIGAANPKNLIVGLAAAATIASASLSAGQQIVAVVVYVVIAVLGVAAPLAVMVALKGRAQPILDTWKAWLGQNNATVMAVLFLVFAVILIGKGIAAL